MPAGARPSARVVVAASAVLPARSIRPVSRVSKAPGSRFSNIAPPDTSHAGTGTCRGGGNPIDARWAVIAVAQQPGNDLGQFIHPHGAQPLTPAGRQQVHRYRRQGTEEPGRRPLLAIDQRRPQDVVRNGQRLQVIVGRALALEVGGIALFGAQGRQLHDVPDAGAVGGLEQGDRRAPVNVVESGAGRFDQAHGVDHHMDAAQPIRPCGRVGVRHVVNGDLGRTGRHAHAFQHPMAIARQGIAKGAADKAIGPAHQDIHVVACLGKPFMVGVAILLFLQFLYRQKLLVKKKGAAQNPPWRITTWYAAWSC
ncbi:hypothetical protein G6F65_018017 [Rhizopus arrhizus]|nr:hypothetical protein G6F65_018017 [Rhizopus arrhizus]